MKSGEGGGIIPNQRPTTQSIAAEYNNGKKDEGKKNEWTRMNGLVLERCTVRGRAKNTVFYMKQLDSLVRKTGARSQRW